MTVLQELEMIDFAWPALAGRGVRSQEWLRYCTPETAVSFSIPVVL